MAKPLKPRSPQLALQLDAAPPDPAARWSEGASLAWCGSQLRLQLHTDRLSAERVQEVLHLPLPPGATARQIQDGVEAWLRQEAMRVIGDSVAAAAQRLGRQAPRWALSFAARGAWVQAHADGSLRIHWRLIEQPEAVIEQTVAQAVAGLPPGEAAADLWSKQVA